MHIDVNLLGTDLRLLPERAILWPQRQTLFVADTHLGKEATFRRQGIPVPSGSTVTTLASISQMLFATAAKHLVILGDMFHARSSLSQDVCEAMSAFCARHAGMRFSMVRGNHDAHVGRLPEDWSVDVLEPGIAHHPSAVPVGADLLLCGHIHPALSMGSRFERFGKLPCFWLSKGCMVLPAIGHFTGTEAVRRKPGDRAWVVAGDQLIEMNTSQQG